MWDGELSSGNAHTASEARPLLEACFAKLPLSARFVFIQADKGFYDHKLIEWIEDRMARLVIVARLTPPINRKRSPTSRLLATLPAVMLLFSGTSTAVFEEVSF